MTKILVIEDDVALNNSLCKGLKLKSFELTAVFDGRQALLQDWNQFDLILADWNLPYFNGIDLIRMKRGQGWNGLCLMLTARSEKADVSLGLDFGADDYIAKPFEWNELYSRINALLRRRNGHAKLATSNSLRWDDQAQAFFEDEKLLNLTNKECKLLKLFLANPKQTFTRSQLINRIYSQDYDLPDSNVIERHITTLRRKLKYDPIQTIWGSGYRLRPD
jgi:DNA-binding response OmpR family regulator